MKGTNFPKAWHWCWAVCLLVVIINLTQHRFMRKDGFSMENYLYYIDCGHVWGGFYRLLIELERPNLRGQNHFIIWDPNCVTWRKLQHKQRQAGSKAAPLPLCSWLRCNVTADWVPASTSQNDSNCELWASLLPANLLDVGSGCNEEAKVSLCGTGVGTSQLEIKVRH